jgi:hypothetical protein
VTGTVTAFDGPRGLGEVTDASGRVYPFHCTEIADGSRTIPLGTAVEFVVIPGLLGRWEAGDLTHREPYQTMPTPPLARKMAPVANFEASEAR